MRRVLSYTNISYPVTLDSPISAGHATNSNAFPQPGCVAVPDGTKELIVRLAGPETEGMSMANRVENEVAIILLASAALDHFRPPMVPRVYGWGSAATSSADNAAQGWIVQELMPGVSLADSFEKMPLDEKRKVFAQMAALLKGLQSYKLPVSITQFGGVTWDDAGRVVSASMPTVNAGPWVSYEPHFKGRLEVALRKATDNKYIKGWEANGLRERLDRFVAEGVPRQFEGLGDKEERVVIHADFSMACQIPFFRLDMLLTTATDASNLLYDPASGRITGLIDYDFATILHPSYEFLRSFSGAGGQFRGWYVDEDGDEAALRKAKLEGFPSPLPTTKPDDGAVNWEDAKAWEDALLEIGVKRPQTIQGIDRVADVDTVLQAILPWRVTNEDVLKLQTEETILKSRDENEEHLDKLLGRLGF